MNNGKGRLPLLKWGLYKFKEEWSKHPHLKNYPLSKLMSSSLNHLHSLLAVEQWSDSQLLSPRNHLQRWLLVGFVAVWSWSFRGFLTFCVFSLIRWSSGDVVIFPPPTNFILLFHRQFVRETWAIPSLSQVTLSASQATCNLSILSDNLHTRLYLPWPGCWHHIIPQVLATLRKLTTIVINTVYQSKSHPTPGKCTSLTLSNPTKSAHPIPTGANWALPTFPLTAPRRFRRK